MPHGSTKPCKIKSHIIIKPCKPYIYIYIQAVQDQSARTWTHINIYVKPIITPYIYIIYGFNTSKRCSFHAYNIWQLHQNVNCLVITKRCNTKSKWCNHLVHAHGSYKTVFPTINNYHKAMQSVLNSYIYQCIKAIHHQWLSHNFI